MIQKMNVNDIEKLYDRLKEDRRVRNWTEFAKPTGYTRTHISEVVNGSQPLTDDLVKAIKDAWLNPTNNVGLEKDYQHLQEKFEMLREHHATINNVVRTNLASLSTMQLVILAEIKAGLKWEAIKAAKGNRKKEQEIQGQLSRIVGENLQAFGVADKSFEMGKFDKQS